MQIKFLKQVTGKVKSNPVNVVALRFLQVFHDHGVVAAQIPRLLPAIKLNDFKSEETLLAALTPEVLDQSAQLLGIRSAWMEGVGDEIFEYQSCYKQPELFFELLANLRSRIHYDFSHFPLRVLSSTNDLDNTDDREQLLVPVLVEKIAELGDEIIYRYHIFNDGFDWGYSPTRIQLKAIARMLFKVLHTPVPIFIVSPVELQNVIDRKKVPRSYIDGCMLTNPSLEDFAITHEESRIAKEVDEMPEVLRYIKEYKLESLITAEPPQHNSPCEPVSESEISSAPLVTSEKPSKFGKRADNNQYLWEPVRAVASALWAEDDALSIAEVINRIKKMPLLKASSLSDSAIRKHINDLAPSDIRGKSGRKPNKST